MSATHTGLSLVAALSLCASTAAMAQSDRDYGDNGSNGDYQSQQQDYDQKQQDYQARQQDYEDRKSDYQARHDAYAVQRDRYSDDRAAYERQRADYDARYGSGSWDRRYGDRQQYSRADDSYGAYRNSPCERQRNSSTVTGGVIGALAGAAIGSNVAGRGERTGGAVLGAVAGGAVGAAVGNSAARCDTRGYYFSYDQTVPYRVASGYGYDSRGGDYREDRYRRMGCRLAPAPAYVNGSSDYRYVRVCPDASGRFRITG